MMVGIEDGKIGARICDRADALAAFYEVGK